VLTVQANTVCGIRLKLFGKTVDIRCSDERITVNNLGIKRHAI